MRLFARTCPRVRHLGNTRLGRTVWFMPTNFEHPALRLRELHARRPDGTQHELMAVAVRPSDLCDGKMLNSSQSPTGLAHYSFLFSTIIPSATGP